MPQKCEAFDDFHEGTDELGGILTLLNEEDCQFLNTFPAEVYRQNHSDM